MNPTNNDLAHILQYINALHELPEPAALKRLIDALRVKDGDQALANAKIDELLDILQAHPEYGVGLAAFILRLTNKYRQITLYTDTGIASDQNFFNSFNRLIGHRFLPLLPEDDSVVELSAYLFDGANDEQWLSLIEPEKLLKLIEYIKVDDNHLDLVATAKNSILNAIVILSYRISGMGLHSDLMLAYPQILNFSAAFVAQNQEAVLFVNEYRRLHELDTLTDITPAQDIDPAPLMVMLGQCQEIVTNIRKRIYKTGISIRMTNMLVRLEQSIERMYTLLNLLSADKTIKSQATANLIKTIVHTSKSRYSFGYLIESNTKLLSRKVTEYASRVVEHYISTDKVGYQKMYKKAAIGGFFIAFMATMKTLAYEWALAPIGRAFINSMIYGLGFVFIHVAHGTVATKQPAMTAAAIASTISESSGKKTQRLAKLSELIVDILRTQFIAILGNISIAMPVALAISYAWVAQYDAPMIDSAKAAHLLHELDPIRSLALPHAAIAGVFLFLSGLIAGYYDNLSAYNKIGARIQRHWLLIKIMPTTWVNKLGTFVENNLGAIMGNFIFGCFLGSTATVGYMLGLPLDIRHIAFASANFVQGLFFLPSEHITAALVITSFLGVLLIGMVNLMVSFSLALIVALRSKEVEVLEWRKIISLVFNHFTTRPLDFIWPRSQSIKYSRIDENGQIIFEDTTEKESKTLSDAYVVRRLTNKKHALPSAMATDAHKINDSAQDVPKDFDPKNDIRDAITAHDNDMPAADSATTTSQNNATTPLPKPDKPPQLPK